MRAQLTQIKQRTPDWYEAHRGTISPSGLAPILVKGGNKEVPFGDGALTYANRKAAERLMLPIEQGPTTAPMERGNTLEGDAITEYEDRMMVTVQRELFLVHPTLPMCFSPDGLVYADGGIEVKCPGLEAHTAAIIENQAPKKYVPQIQTYLWATGRKWWDFVSYFPELEDERRLFVVRVLPDPDYHAKLDERIGLFCALVDQFAGRLGVTGWKPLREANTAHE